MSLNFKINLLLDSGAFSAWRRRSEINLDEYISYCKRHRHEVDAYVALDCIPGKDGKMDHSQSAIERSAAKSYENLQIMKSEGLEPIPVFHQGERFYWLDKMLEDGETYVGISPYLRSHQNEIIEWMDRCFTRITDRYGKPLIKTHGFGVTACNLCTRYPWYSVDSTSWSVAGGYGAILVPHYRDGQPDYTRPPLTIRITARKIDQSRGFDGLNDQQQEAVRLAAKDADVSLVEMRNSFWGRWKFNMTYFSGLAKECDGKRFQNRTPTLFGTEQGIPRNNAMVGYDPGPIRMYFATVLHTKHHNLFLNELQIANRLLSYAFLKEVEDDFLGKYLQTGVPEIKKQRPRKMSLKMLNSEMYRVKRSYAIVERAGRKDDAEDRPD